MHGTMIWFNHSKRHGFIRTEEGERLLVEETGFAPGQQVGPRCAGTEVTFERVEPSDGGPRAIEVGIVPQIAARRARSRRRGS